MKRYIRQLFVVPAIFGMIFTHSTLNASHTNFETSSSNLVSADTTLLAIKIGDVYKNDLKTGDAHGYTLNIDSDYYVYGFANQKSVDVVVTIYDPENEKIGTFDGPARGREAFQITTKSAGLHRFEITPFEDTTGDYEFQIVVAEPTANTPEKKVAQFMTPYSGNVPGGVVMVMKDGEIIFNKGYGMASLTYDIPFTVDTPTNIGSTSKQFTAFSIALLEERGLLSLDDDVRKYIPELPDFGHTVTLRHMLSHTSGYREFLNTLAMTGRSMNNDMSDEQLFRIIQRQPELQNIPGDEFNYNNTTFYLATIVVERVTEEDFVDWTRENIFQPLGMMNTTYRRDHKHIIPGRAVGYENGDDGTFHEVEDLAGGKGPGGIYTTVNDLAKWLRNFKDQKVGSATTHEKMVTSNLLNSGKPSNYGLGLFVNEYKGQKYIQHGGADVAHRSMLMYFPDIDAAVVTQSNFASFDGSIASKVADAFFEEFFDKPEEDKESDDEADVTETSDFEYDVTKFEDLTGRYELVVAPGFILTFSRDGDRIYTQATGQPEVNIQATSDSTFTLVGVPAALTFHRNSDGTADSLTLHQNGNHIAKKVVWNPSVEEMTSFTGTFYSEEIETIYRVVLNDENLELHHYQISDPIKMTPGNEDIFSAGFPIAEIKFMRDENGNVTGFEASNVRARGIQFKKVTW